MPEYFNKRLGMVFQDAWYWTKSEHRYGRHSLLYRKERLGFYEGLSIGEIEFFTGLTA